MDKVIDKTYQLIDCLDESKIIQELKYYKNILLNDEEVLNKISKYKETNDINIKKELYNNENYKKYMELYNELFYIVMSINNRFKKLTENRVCHEGY